MYKIPEDLLPEFYSWMCTQEASASQTNRMVVLRRAAEAFIAKHSLLVAASTALYQYLMTQE